MATIALLGPPEVAVSDKKPADQTGNPFIDQLVSDFNTLATNPTIGRTENNSPTFLSTGNPCLDFFFHTVPDSPPSEIINRLQDSWNHDPLKTLKLVCNLRGVRGTGKSDKEGFYTSALWIHSRHPKTLACNLNSIAAFGYFKDLPELLYRLLEGADIRKRMKSEWEIRKRKGKGKTVKKGATKEEASEIRKVKRIAAAKKAIARYTNDADFRFLHDQISTFFSKKLLSDIDKLRNGESKSISFAAKWCPSVDSSYDIATLLCETIAKKLFPRESYEGVDEAHYAYRVRDRLRKEILVPLRKALELPEVYIGANDWSSIPYTRVASVAMKLYKPHFLKHDRDRFQQYLSEVRAGEKKIAAGALLPHQIISSSECEVSGLQWDRMVDDMKKKGKLKNCMAVCDVSASMNGTPMEVSVAMGLLVSELSEEPWKGKVITFSDEPELHVIEGETLNEKESFVREMQWGAGTDFQKVFDRILAVAVAGNIPAEEMVKRLFVFSDMEFNQASVNDWETDYMEIQRKFREKGYAGAVPEIVFWNLRDSKATPVPETQNGVALVSGFSKNLMNLFLQGDGIITPLMTMEAAIAGPEYQALVIMD